MYIEVNFELNCTDSILKVKTQTIFWSCKSTTASLFQCY